MGDGEILGKSFSAQALGLRNLGEKISIHEDEIKAAPIKRPP